MEKKKTNIFAKEKERGKEYLKKMQTSSNGTTQPVKRGKRKKGRKRVDDS